jgi:metal-responsive CopG/Arc/MetJ family transcriptional regulator
MNEQINLRLPQNLLASAKNHAQKNGYGTIQEFIKETIREKLFDEPKLSKEELGLVKKLAEASIKKGRLGTEKQLFAKLKAQ